MEFPEEMGKHGRRGRKRTSIIRILLLPHALDGAIKRAEQTAPNAEVTTEDGRARFDGREGADAAFAVGGVAEAFYAVPESAADGLFQGD